MATENGILLESYEAAEDRAGSVTECARGR